MSIVEPILSQVTNQVTVLLYYILIQGEIIINIVTHNKNILVMLKITLYKPRDFKLYSIFSPYLNRK